jgi:hypothetical protein
MPLSDQSMRTIVLALMIVTLTIGATRAEDRAPVAAPPDYIGRARMLDDGTLELFLVAYGPGGLIGHSLLVYRPSDPQYGEILAHIGPMKPREEKAVRAWPDKE